MIFLSCCSLVRSISLANEQIASRIVDEPKQQRMHVRKEGEDVYVAAAFDERNTIFYWFKPCMFNRLMTFYQVSVLPNTIPIADINPNDKKHIVLNRAHSDNIGPFLIRDGGWVGGNHSFKDSIATAECLTYQVIVNDAILSKDTALWTDHITFKVVNKIWNPVNWKQKITKDDQQDVFCYETVFYQVEQNKIAVEVRHDYVNAHAVVVDRYYGLQSMFNGEDEICTPNGAYERWTAKTQVGRFNKRDFPNFNLFLERNNAFVQATYLAPRGLGMHQDINPDAPIFIGNSSDKCYHNMIAGKVRKRGDQDVWYGSYSWFDRSVTIDQIGKKINDDYDKEK